MRTLPADARSLFNCRPAENADERLVSKVLEYVQGIAEVKNYDLTRDSTTQVHGAVEEARRASFGMELPSILYMLAQFVINKLTGIAVCAAAIAFYFGGTMELSNCLLMLICSFILFEQLDSAGSFSSLFRSIDIGVDKANSILSVEPMDTNGEELAPESEDIALSHVNFSYDSKPILHDVSLTIPEKIYERHCFFKQRLISVGVDEKTAEKEACLLEHSLSDDSFDKIKKAAEGKHN